MNKFKLTNIISLVLWVGILIQVIFTNNILDLKASCIIFSLYMIGDLFKLWDRKGEK